MQKKAEKAEVPSLNVELFTSSLPEMNLPGLEIDYKPPRIRDTNVNLDVNFPEVSMPDVKFPNIKFPRLIDVAEVEFADIKLELGQIAPKIDANPQRGIVPIIKEEVRRRKYAKKEQQLKA